MPLLDVVGNVKLPPEQIGATCEKAGVIGFEQGLAIEGRIQQFPPAETLTV
jgi:hypothetical protein